MCTLSLVIISRKVAYIYDLALTCVLRLLTRRDNIVRDVTANH